MTKKAFAPITLGEMLKEKFCPYPANCGLVA
jgi:hypothetical protein